MRKNRSRQQGFTLIELIIVIVALTAGAVFVGNSFLAPARAVVDNENIQASWQIAQGCADHLMGQARALFSNVPVGSGTCPNLSGSATGTYTVSDTSGAGACTGIAGANVCRSVAVSASNGGGYTAALTFMIVNY